MGCHVKMLHLCVLLLTILSVNPAIDAVPCVRTVVVGPNVSSFGTSDADTPSEDHKRLRTLYMAKSEKDSLDNLRLRLENGLSAT
ncbi:hypothetical protein BV898_19268 [Hypsibius exemplaris]|uniref:Uncharacterized protein n=1 Tax=Hypsibius exemplaris TaxID=2072580 RepID=A0A9X6RPL0_HYPEX|nr:hypothetical protein BV898_19268 [Hypsibius exemplaris]